VIGSVNTVDFLSFVGRKINKMNWLKKIFKIKNKGEKFTSSCRCWSPEVMDIASHIAIAMEEKKTIEQGRRTYSTASGCDVKCYLSNEPHLSFGYKNMEEFLEWQKKYVVIPEMEMYTQ